MCNHLNKDCVLGFASISSSEDNRLEVIHCLRVNLFEYDSLNFQLIHYSLQMGSPLHV